jgi:thioredoxin 2
MQHIVCTACNATNRVDPAKDGREGKCGKCGAALFSGAPTDLPAAAIEAQIARSDIPVVIDVWAPWCGPCRVMGPEFQKAAGAVEPRVRFLKLNSDDNQELAGRLGIRGIPTMILYRNGREAARVSGAMQSGQIVRWIESNLTG